MDSQQDQILLNGERLSLVSHGAVATARLFNPPHGCMDARTESELAAMLDLLQANAHIGVLVLTGRDPGVFVRHYDIALLEKRGRDMAARGLRFSIDRPVPESPLHRCLARIEASPCIFVAAINGHCMGGGYELTLACDLRYAQHGHYRIGLPEVNLGLLPGAGGTQKMQRVMGRARALEALLLGRTFEPAEALSHGLVHGTASDVLHHALAVAQELAGKPVAALRHIKRLVRRADAADLAQGLAEERTLFCDLMVNEETLHRLAEVNAGERDISDR
jgi:enoyl-CoA hydratase/carnithine racemase